MESCAHPDSFSRLTVDDVNTQASRFTHRGPMMPLRSARTRVEGGNAARLRNQSYMCVDSQIGIEPVSSARHTAAQLVSSSLR